MVRDEAERLRHLIGRQRRTDALVQAGQLVLLIEGEGVLTLEEGLLVEHDNLFGPAIDSALTMTRDGHEDERLIVAQWLRANAEKVRVLDSPRGYAMRADRIPRIVELLPVRDADEPLEHALGSTLVDADGRQLEAS